MIKIIETKGLKNKDWKADLSPVTVINGPSRTGKTLLLDAIRISYLGYTPTIGKRASRLKAMMSSPKATITINGESVKVGKTKVDGVLSGVSEYSLNPEGFLALGPTDKSRALLEQFAPSKTELANIIKRLPNAMRTRVANLGLEDCMKEVGSQCRDLAKQSDAMNSAASEIESIPKTWPDDLEKQMSELSAKLNEATVNATNLDNAEVSLFQLQEELLGFTEDQGKLMAYKEELASLPEQTITLEAARSCWADTKAQMDAAKKHNSKLGSNECPTCKRPFDKVKVELIDIDPLRIKHNEAEELCELEQKRAQVLQRIEGLKVKLSAETKIKASIIKLKDEIAKLESKCLKEEHKSDLISQVQSLQEQQNLKTKSEHNRATKQSFLVKANEFSEASEAIKPVLERLKKLRAKLVDERLERIATLATSIGDGMDFKVSEGEIVLSENDQLITFAAMCGAEKVVLGTAAAIVMAGKFKLVLVDELGRMDSTTRNLFLWKIYLLQKDGIIDQFIGCDTGVRRYDASVAKILI